MAKPKIYFDSCAFIEVAKGRFGKPQVAERVAEADMCNRLLSAARDGKLEIFTSTITIAEAVHIGDMPPPDDVKQFLERLLLSGNGVTPVEPDPFVVESARDLAWNHGIGGRLADKIHIASYMRANCTELISTDGVLARRIGNALAGVNIIFAGQTTCLPPEYKPSLPDLFSHDAAEKK